MIEMSVFPFSGLLHANDFFSTLSSKLKNGKRLFKAHALEKSQNENIIIASENRKKQHQFRCQKGKKEHFDSLKNARHQSK